MGVLSKLFGSSGKKDKSYVRTWAEKRKYELRHSYDISSDNLFAAMMYGLSSFGKKDPKRNMSSDLKKLGMDSSEQFSGDEALFELGCYMFFRVDLWLFKNEPSRREVLSTSFTNNFIALFSQALDSKKIPKIFDKRISGYRQLVRNGADAERYHYHLSQLILRTKDNQPPEDYDFDSSPVMITGIFEDMGLKIELASWEQGMLPATIESLKNFLGYDKEKEISDNEVDNNALSDHDLDKLGELIEENKYKDAIEKIDGILRRNENNVEAYNYKAGILQLMGKQDEAINLYKYIIENFNYIDSYIELIEIYNLDNKENPRKIIDLCKKLELIDENKTKTPYYLMAQAYSNLDDYELALETYDKAVRQEKFLLEVYSRMLNDPKHEKHIKESAQEEMDDSKLYEVYCGKASVLTELGKYEEAIDTYEVAINLNVEKNCEHESSFEYESIADIYSLLGNTEKAAYYLKKANVFEKISNDLYDKETYGMTDDEFNKWYDDHVELDDEGNIINIKSNKKGKNEQ